MRQDQGRRDRRRNGAITIVLLALLVLIGGTAATAVAAPPAPSFTATPVPARVGAPVTFAADAPGLGKGTITWDFGDGTSATGGVDVLVVQHAYETLGPRTVTLTVSRPGDDAQVVAGTFDVLGPQAAFTSSTDTPNVGDAVGFDASASSDPPDGFSGYAWDFGDGTTGAGVTATHAYDTPGPRTVTLTTTSAVDGRTATATRTLRVNALPVAGFGVDPASPRTGQKVTLTSTASDPDGAQDVASVSWDLDGDGVYAEASGPTAAVAFLTAGDYTVGQRVVDRNGAAATAFRTITVRGAPAPPASGGDDPATPGDDGGPVVVVVPSPGEPALPPAGSGTDTPAGATPGSLATPTTAAGSGGARRLRILTSVRVRLAGTVSGDLTRLTSLSVVGPKGTLFRVRCAGRGCPAKPLRVRLARTGSKRVRALQRTFRAGTRLTVNATKRGYVPRRVVLTFRRGVPPARKEQCLYPGARKGQTRAAACPAR